MQGTVFLLLLTTKTSDQFGVYPLAKTKGYTPNELVFPIFVSDQKLEDSLDLLLLIDDDKSHYVYIENFNRFIVHKTKNKNKKWFCKSCLRCFSSENVLTKHK